MGSAAKCFGKNKKIVCDFCAQECQSDGAVVWDGRSTLVCCKRCAEEALPMMIGDSLHLPPEKSPYYAAEKEWDGRFKARFLRAVLARCHPRKDD